MEWVQASQIITVVVFLAALIAVRFWIIQQRGRLAGRLRPGKTLEVVEVLALGPQERLTLVRVGAQQVLVHSPRNGQTVLMPMPTDANANTPPPALIGDAS